MEALSFEQKYQAMSFKDAQYKGVFYCSKNDGHFKPWLLAAVIHVSGYVSIRPKMGTILASYRNSN
jgi:hypothetical protein